MMRIVLPGYGTPATFNVPEDSTIGVFSGGRMFTVSLKANVPTRVEFVKSNLPVRLNEKIVPVRVGLSLVA